MKIPTIILSILIMQTSASFFDDFDDFRGAFVSVENNFGALLNDVVTDVKVAIDCTIMAVEQVLSLGGMFRDISDYERRCKGEKDVATEAPAIIRQASYIQEVPKVPKKDNVVTKNLSKEIETSISNINQTLNNFLDKRDAYHKIENVKTVLKNETDRLTEVSALLSRELEHISAKVKKEFEKMDFKPNGSTAAEDIANEVKILYELEKMDDNTSEGKEIRHVLDEVLDVFHGNESANLTNDEEFKEIITDLEKTSNETFIDIENQFSQWKEEEKKQLDNIKDVVESKKSSDEKELEIVEDVSKKLDVLPDKVNDFPVDFKDVFNVLTSKPSVSDTEQDKVNEEVVLPDKVDDFPLNFKNVFNVPTSKPSLSDTKQDKVNEEVVFPDEVEDFPVNFKHVFHVLSKPSMSDTEQSKVNEEARKPFDSGVENKSEIMSSPLSNTWSSDVLSSNTAKIDTRSDAAKEAAEIMERSRLTQLLMHSIVSNAGEESIVSAFDDPELLNFG